MTIYHGSKTHVDIDRARGTVRVWDAETGRLIDEFDIDFGTPERVRREEEA